MALQHVYKRYKRTTKKQLKTVRSKTPLSNRHAVESNSSECIYGALQEAAGRQGRPTCTAVSGKYSPPPLPPLAASLT